MSEKRNDQDLVAASPVPSLRAGVGSDGTGGQREAIAYSPERLTANHGVELHGHRRNLKASVANVITAQILSGEIRAGASPKDLLYAVASLCLPVADEGVVYSQRMVALLINGLRHEADTTPCRS